MFLQGNSCCEDKMTRKKKAKIVGSPQILALPSLEENIQKAVTT